MLILLHILISFDSLPVIFRKRHHVHWAGNARTDSGGRYLTSYLTTSMGYLSGRPIIQCAFAAGVTAALQVRSTETAYSHTALASVCSPCVHFLLNARDASPVYDWLGVKTN